MTLTINFATNPFTPDKIELDCNMMTLQAAVDLPLSEKDILNLGKNSVRKFKICNWNHAPTDKEWKDQLFKQFFKKWGSIIQTLELRDCDTVGFPPMVWALHYSRNLKTLYLNDCSLRDYTKYEKEGNCMEQDEYLKNYNGLKVECLIIDKFSNPKLPFDPIRCFSMLEKFPVLKELIIYLRHPLMVIDYHPDNGLMKSLRHYRKLFGNGSLCVTIHGLVEFSGSIDELLGTTLPLENWLIGFPKRDSPYELGRRCRHLRMLKIDHSVSSPIARANFSHFPYGIEIPSLLELQLIGKYVDSLNFLKFMPALGKVILKLQLRCSQNPPKDKQNNRDDESNKENEGKRDLVENTLPKYRAEMKMRYLSYLEVNHLFKLESLEDLRNMIPNLTVLKMVFRNNRFFSFACVSWPNLVHLSALPGSQIDDKGITGVCSLHDQNSFRTYNLLDLKYLQTFEVWSDLELTDNFFYLSIISMPRLRKLMILGPFKFSKTCIKLLNKRFIEWKI